jgi:hypothetical protein
MAGGELSKGSQKNASFNVFSLSFKVELGSGDFAPRLPHLLIYTRYEVTLNQTH